MRIIVNDNDNNNNIIIINNENLVFFVIILLYSYFKKLEFSVSWFLEYFILFFLRNECVRYIFNSSSICKFSSHIYFQQVASDKLFQYHGDMNHAPLAGSARVREMKEIN